MGHDIVLTFAGGLISALLLGYVALRLGLSPIVGYLLAGILVGPHTPGYIASAAVAEQFAEIGIILLMFGVGMKFQLHELVAVWRVALPGAIFQSAASTLLTLGLLVALGWRSETALVTGLAVSVASTVVLVRVLSDSRDLSSRTGHIAVGWVVVEDLLTILLLVALPVIASAPGQDAGLTLPLLGALGKVLLCAAAALLVGGKVIPWMLSRVSDTRSRELFMLAVLAVALGIAVLAAKLFGVSMALGAFLAGLVVARSDYSARAAAEALPMRDAFAVLFFVSVGLLFNPTELAANPMPALALTAVVVIGKPVAAAAVMWMVGESRGAALRVGAALGQAGEFTFVLGSAARGLGLLDAAAWNSLVAVAMISIAMNPSLYRLAIRLAPSRRNARETAVAAGSGHTVLVGHGDIGERVLADLIRRGTPVVVVDSNLAIVRRLQRAGRQALCGDASLGEVLEEAGVARAAALVVCCSLRDEAKLLGELASRYPSLRIVARQTADDELGLAPGAAVSESSFTLSLIHI